MYEHATTGTCSRAIQYDIYEEDGVNVKFVGGCAGNTQGVAKLVEGMRADEVVSRLKGIKCGFKPTSCPDQLARAIEAQL